MTTNKITVELSDKQCQEILNEGWEEPHEYRHGPDQAYALLAIAVREQWFRPPREPRVGDVVRFQSSNIARTVHAVTDGWVYMSPAHGLSGDEPNHVRLTNFHDLYEVVS